MNLGDSELFIAIAGSKGYMDSHELNKLSSIFTWYRNTDFQSHLFTLRYSLINQLSRIMLKNFPMLSFKGFKNRIRQL